MYLRTVYLFVTVHMFCAHLDGPKCSGFVSVLPGKTKYFEAVYNYAGKAVLERVVRI